MKFIRLVICSLAGMGASAVADQFIKNNTPETTSRLGKVAIWVVTLMGGAIAGSLMYDASEKQIDKFEEMFKTIQE